MFIKKNHPFVTEKCKTFFFEGKKKIEMSRSLVVFVPGYQEDVLGGIDVNSVNNSC